MPAEALALEQEGDAGRLLESLFESYASACRSGAEVDDGADAVFEEGMGRVREHLLSATGAEAACMVCLETIRPEEPVWACADGCHAAMHLPCIQSWARRALADAREKASQRLNPQLFPAAAAEAQRTAAWACPKCRCAILPAACLPARAPSQAGGCVARGCLAAARVLPARCWIATRPLPA